MKTLKKFITLISCVCIIISISQLSYNTNSDISIYSNDSEYPNKKV